MKELERENVRLKRLVADLSLEKQVLKDVASSPCVTLGTLVSGTRAIRCFGRFYGICTNSRKPKANEGVRSFGSKSIGTSLICVTGRMKT